MMRSRRSVLRLIGLGGIGGLGVLVACRPSAPAATSGGAPATVAPIVPSQATPPPVVPAATPTAAAAAAPAGAIKRGGQATILQTNDFVSMDPIHASGPTAAACYDWLLAWRPNPDGTYAVQPSLARAWETSADKIVFHLRDGVRFHDGSDLTADVVAWNLNRMVQNPKSFARNYLSAVGEKNPATGLGFFSVQLNLTRPSAAVLANLSDAAAQGNNTAIVSKKAADDHGEEWLALNPVGTGPFRLVRFAFGGKLQGQAQEKYWEMGA